MADQTPIQPVVHVSLNITPDQINGAVVQAIVDSAVGKTLHAEITKAVTHLGSNSYWDSPLRKQVEQVVAATISERVDALMRPEIERAIAAQLTPERLQPLITAAADNAMQRIAKLVAGREW